MPTNHHLNRSSVLALALTVFICTGSQAQSQLRDWKIHTSLRSATQVVIGGEEIWVGTSGGVYSVSAGEGEIARYTPLDGLHSVSPTAIAYDDLRDALWIGYADGVIDRLDIGAQTVSTYRDVERATQFSSRGINIIQAIGDSVYFATDFGVVIFDPLLNEVRDSYTRLGTFAAATAVRDLLVAPIDGGAEGIWAATDEGLAFASLSDPNLKDPSAWVSEPTPNFALTTVDRFGTSVFVGTPGDLFRRTSPGAFDAVGVTSFGILDCELVDDALFCVDPFKPIRIAPDLTSRAWISDDLSSPAKLAASATMWVADQDLGLVNLEIPADPNSDLTVIKTVVPDGPFDNGFSDLTIAPNGDLWLGGTSEAGSGFYRFAEDGTWGTFTSVTESVLAGKSRFTRVHVDAMGNAWAASEGGGLARVAPDGTVTVFDESNSSLRSVTGFQDFIIVGGVDSDADGNVWVTTRGASVALHVMTPDGSWTALPPYVGDGLTSGSTAFDRVLADSFGQLWIIVRDPTSFNVTRGLLVVDPNRTPTDSSDDSFRYFRTRGGGGQGLPSVNVRAVVEGRDGLMWLGTAEGPAYFVNTGIVARDDNSIAIWPQRVDRSEATFLFLGLPINDLMVDPANQLWVATNDGIRIVAQGESGFEEVATISESNSPLFSDEIISMAVRGTTGEVYIATNQGLQSVVGPAVESTNDAGELFIYPNPVVLTEASVISVEGLIDDSDLRIVDVTGSLVAKFETRGGRFLWDGRDENGTLVESGIYIFVGVSRNGDQTVIGKGAVIR